MKDEIIEEAKKAGTILEHGFYWFESISSTNTKALEMARRGAEHLTVLMAEAQESGRGRLGRNWVSPPGTGLYTSIILRPDLAPEDLAKITLAAGLAVSRAIENETGMATLIKWPNDVLANGKKVAGVLTESTGVGTNQDVVVVVGVGINVTTPREAFGEELHDKASSIAEECSKAISKGSLLNRLVAEIDRAVKKMEGGHFLKILDEWKRRDASLGKNLDWLNAKREVVSGISLGPDENGCLQVRDSSGRLHEVISGDVTLKA